MYMCDIGFDRAFYRAHLAAALKGLAAELRPDDRDVRSQVAGEQVVRYGGAARPPLHAGLNERWPHNHVPVRIDNDPVPRPLVQLPELGAASHGVLRRHGNRRGSIGSINTFSSLVSPCITRCLAPHLMEGTRPALQGMAGMRDHAASAWFGCNVEQSYRAQCAGQPMVRERRAVTTEWRRVKAPVSSPGR